MKLQVLIVGTAIVAGVGIGYQVRDTTAGEGTRPSTEHEYQKVSVDAQELKVIQETSVATAVEQSFDELSIANESLATAEVEVSSPTVIDDAEALEAFEQVSAVVQGQSYSDQWRPDEIALIATLAPKLTPEHSRKIIDEFISAMNSGEISPRPLPPL